jgi:L-ascorbate metabolism protein UlaG (beta-lactamase superfamily)
MNGEPLYLRSDVQVEPLVDQWYAWSFLVPPATTARHITHRHFPILDSYIAAPAVHATAVKNPRMLGGPFVDYAGGRVDEITALRERTVARRTRLIELSRSLEQLEAMLQADAHGHSLIPLYPRVPEALRGFVDLSYDLRNRASFRLIESLLYRTGLYDTTCQSLMLSLTHGDDRPFVMSTPRLESPDSVHLHWSFADERLDQLFRLKSEAKSWTWIRSALGLDDDLAARLRVLFTPDAPAPYEPYDGAGLRWRYFGHACILVETRQVRMLFDPVVSYTYETRIPRYTYADIPERIDYVLITHNHQDHILLETLLQIRHKVGAIIVPRGGTGQLQDPSLALILRHAGFRNVIELGELETLTLRGTSVTGIPFLGEHGDLFITTKLGYVVTIGNHQLMFAADSCNVEPRLYEQIHAAIGDVGTMFLGMECQGAPMSWAYGPLLLCPLDRDMDQSRRLSGSDFEQAIALVNRFNCHDVYVYAMGQEPWLNHVMSIKYTEQSRPIVESNRLLEACRARGIAAERLFGEREILVDQVYHEPFVAGTSR